MRNMAPADELAAIRYEIKHLRERETELKLGLAAGTLPSRGGDWEAYFRHSTRRVFVKDRLPPQVLADARYWRETGQDSLCLRALPRTCGPKAPPAPGPDPGQRQKHPLLEPI